MPPTSIDSYIPKDNRLQSETVHYKRGVCQQFCLPSHTVDPSEWADEEVSRLGGVGPQAAGRKPGRALHRAPDGPGSSKVMLTLSLVTSSHP